MKQSQQQFAAEPQYTAIHLGDGGYRQYTQRNLNDPTKDRIVNEFGGSGSVLRFQNGVTEFIAQLDLVNHIGKDNFTTINGQCETHIHGNENHTVYGNQYIKIGPCHKTAIEKIEQIKQKLQKIYQNTFPSSKTS